MVNQEGTNSFLDWFFPRMAAPSIFIVPGILLGFLLLWKGGLRGRIFLGVIGLALLVGDAGIVNGLKKAVNRPRPHESVEGVRLVTKEEVRISHPKEIVTKGRSFPSGHVCNNVALAMVVVAVYGRRYRWVYLWALLMGWNRIYLGVHFPSDVLFSFFLSFGYTKIILWGGDRILARYGVHILSTQNHSIGSNEC
jgi:undecaprenyl-diphosphatase